MCGTHLDSRRSRRPGSVRPARVPAVFGQVISPGHVRECTQAGTCPRWTSASPTTFTCMLICIRAWPASLCRGVPLTGFSRPTCSRIGRGFSQPARTALPCRETENLSISYMRSILHGQDQLVKGLGSSPTHSGKQTPDPSRDGLQLDRDCAAKQPSFILLQSSSKEWSRK